MIVRLVRSDPAFLSDGNILQGTLIAGEVEALFRDTTQLYGCTDVILDSHLVASSYEGALTGAQSSEMLPMNGIVSEMTERRDPSLTQIRSGAKCSHNKCWTGNNLYGQAKCKLSQYRVTANSTPASKSPKSTMIPVGHGHMAPERGLG